ncbi:hypothetical protein FOVG_16190 [Fusarium oxysporum f. sp. pisi HDV247]|uniref:CHAT domain-containing protein n=1 Tax=Fusarium oxysporum f. sp. pisi HDV247 TaxID=1080344 RepID=W9NPL5_FUSOX|nr:hypothetical protein FOVG_16190 [Fusarium oxysporum f. sp. pisi HDV247]
MALADSIKEAQARSTDHGIALDPRVEISRPGTWKAFEELLILKTEGWHRRGGQGPWYDVVHFDVHGAILRDRSYLLFLDPTGEKAHAKQASVVGKLLASCKIEFVFLNSCESAKVDGPAAACLVRTFTQVGINTAVGMSHKLTGTAAKCLVRAFYLNLFSRTAPDFFQAILAARDALQTSPERLARYNLKVQLSDSILPVVYRMSNADQPFARWNDMHDSSHAVKNTPADIDAIRSFISTEALQKPSTNLAGREFAVLDMEWALTKPIANGINNEAPPYGKIVILHGSAGVGKTTFALFLAFWWFETEMIERGFYRSQVKEHLDVIVEEMAKNDVLGVTAGSKPRLLIVDQLHACVEPLTDDPWDDHQMLQFATAIHQVMARGHHVLLVTRIKEPWSITFPSAVYHHLKPPSPYDASVLVGDILKGLRLGSPVGGSSEAKFVDCLNHIWQYNPLAMCEIWSELDYFRDSNLITSIRDFFDRVVSYQCPIFFGAGDGNFDECMDFINSFPAKGNRWREQTMLILSTLATTCGIFSQEYFKLVHLNCSLSKFGRMFDPNDGIVRAFISDVLVPSGWVEEVEEIVGVPVTYYRIQTMFLSAMRVSRQTPISDRVGGDYMAWNFTEFLIRRAATWNLSNPRYVRQTELEACNFLKAFDMCLADIKRPLGGIVNRDNWGTVGCYALINLLWSYDGHHPLLSKETILLPRLVELTDILKEKVASQLIEEGHGTDNLTLLLSATLSLAEYYFMKDPSATRRYTEEALKLVVSCPSHLKMWNKVNWKRLADCVFYWTFSMLYLSRPVKPSEGFGVVLRIARLLSRKADGTEVDLKYVRPLDHEPGDPNSLEIHMSPYEQRERIRAFNDVNPYAYSVALLRHRALTGIAHYYRSLGDPRSGQWDDKANDVFAVIMCMWPRDLRTYFLKLTMDETIEFDARDFSFACLGLANQLPFALDMVRAQQLRAAGSETEAKDRLLDIVARCYQDGYLAGEKACQINLAELAISVGNLDEALVSIDRLCVIRDSAPGGPWIRGGLVETFECCLYGSTYLQAGRLMDALYCFEKPVIKAMVPNYCDLSILKKIWERTDQDAPGVAVSLSIYLVRSGLVYLFLLPVLLNSVRGKPISREKLHELEDIAVRAIMMEARRHWNLSITPFPTPKPLEIDLDIGQDTIIIDPVGLTLTKGRGLTLNQLNSLLGPLERKTSVWLESQCEQELDDAIKEGRLKEAGVEEKVDFSKLEDLIPSLKEAMDEIPDYGSWARQLVKNEQIGS